MTRRLGNYELIREIGRGAMGVVYEARQPGLDRRVAVKILHPAFADDARRVQRFRHEAELAAGLHHPAIVPVYEFGDDDGTLYYSMELVDGAPLDRLVRFLHDHPSETTAGRPITTVLEIASKTSTTTDDTAPTMEAPGPALERTSLPVRLPADEGYVRSVVAIAADVAEALHVAHTEKGIVHRDVKPSNLMLDRYGRVRVLDFGIAMDRDVLTLTLHDEAVGTLPYMSPEQLVGSRLAELDARSDVYSLGATLYELLVFEPPFMGRTQAELERRIKWSMPASLRAKRRGISRDLEIIVLHALRKNPEDRYATALDFAKDLRRFLVHEAPLAAPISRVERAALWYRRNLVPATAAAVLLIAGAATAGVSMQRAANDRALRFANATLWIKQAKDQIPEDTDKPWPTYEVIALASKAKALVPESAEIQEQTNFMMKLAADRQAGVDQRDTKNRVDTARADLDRALPRAYFLDLAKDYLNDDIDEKRARLDLKAALDEANAANRELLRWAPEKASFEALFLSARMRLRDVDFDDSKNAAEERECIREALDDLDAAEKIAAGARDPRVNGVLELKERLYARLGEKINAEAVRTRKTRLGPASSDLDYALAAFVELPKKVSHSEQLRKPLAYFGEALFRNPFLPIALCGRGVAAFKMAGQLALEHGPREERALYSFIAARDMNAYAMLDRESEYPFELLGCVTYYFDMFSCNQVAVQDLTIAARIADRLGNHKTATLEYEFGILFLDDSWPATLDLADRLDKAQECFEKGLGIDAKNAWCIAGLGAVDLFGWSVESFRSIENRFRASIGDPTVKTELLAALRKTLETFGKGPNEHMFLSLLATYYRAVGDNATAIEKLKSARASYQSSENAAPSNGADAVDEVYDHVLAEWSQGA